MLRSAITLLTIYLSVMFALPTMGYSVEVQNFNDNGNEQISLQLDWQYQFEYAGFIVAKEKGFYTDAGLDVALHEYKPGIDVIADVLSGKATYGIYNSSLVVAKHKLLPTVLIATYMQSSPLVLVTKLGINNPIDLVGKKIMLTTDEKKHSSLALLFDHFGINRGNSTFVEHNFSIQDFVAGKVDAMSAFLSNQIFALDQAHITYNIINPATYGFYVSACNLFTSQDEAYSHTERSERFRAASNQGWTYAFAHQDEVIQLIHAKYAPNKSIAALTFEAQITRKLFQLQLYPIGNVSNELAQRTYKQMVLHNLLDNSQQHLPANLNQIISHKADTIGFTAAERAYLQQKKQITMGIDPDWMPFEKIHNGKHYGVAADYMKLFQQKLPVPIVLVPTKSWQETIDLAYAHKCDILSLAASTPERLQHLDFTPAYLSVPVVIVTTTDKIYINHIKTILDKKIGVVRGYAFAEQMRNQFPTINIVDVASLKDGMKRVESGELFCYIDNLMVVADQIQKNFTTSLKVSGRLDEGINQVNLAVGTRNDEPLLHSIFTKLVNSITPEQRKGILDRWAPITTETKFDYKLLWILLGVLCGICLLYFYHVTQLKKYNHLLLKLSETDKLTGLYNRSKLDELLKENYELFLRYATPCGVAILDIDFFKQINDTYGHQTGDIVLVELAQLMTLSMRTTDIIGRWGGEEFLILAPNSNAAETTKLANNLLAQFRAHKWSEVGTVAASCGVSAFASDTDINATLRRADNALYAAKDGGRDQVICAQQDGS